MLGIVANAMGYGKYVTMFKKLASAKRMYDKVIAGGVDLEFLYPILTLLGHEKTNAANAALDLYYLGRYHQLTWKMNGMAEHVGFKSGDEGVLESHCPVELIDLGGQYLSAAQWLYSANLSPPHDNNAFSTWYLSRLVSRQGWSVLYCQNETTVLCDGQKCPGFALLARSGSIRASLTALYNI